MKFAIEQRWDRVTPVEYEAVFFDEAFSDALGAALGLGRTLLRLDRTPTRIVRHVRCTPARARDSEAAQVLDERAAFVEELDFDRRSGRGAWRTVPSVFADRVTNAGTLTLEAVPGGVRCVVDGEVRVRMFGFGRVVERKIVAEIENHYRKAAQFTAEWLGRRG